MVFSSVTFLFYFLPCFLLAYFLTPAKQKNFTLLAFSLIFYTWGEPVFVLVLCASIAVNTWVALRVTESTTPKLALALGVAGNLLVLILFKYLDFFIETARSLVGDMGGRLPGPVELHLPLGISFFTFQAISYLIDVSRHDTIAERSVIRVGAYIAMFPQLIAGPIVRFKTIQEDLHEKRISMNHIARGIEIFVIGLVMKILLADIFAVSVDRIFTTNPSQLTMTVAWGGALAYAFQIYFDFCGYSYMAIGLGLICGLRLPGNFNYPYISQSITEFWQRWHISLSSWFRDYLYIPLGGNRGTRLTTYRNLMIVFILCGLWHGAAWTFLFWGLYQGMFLVIERSGLGLLLQYLPVAIRYVYTWLVLLLGWVLFRSNDINYALDYIVVMFTFELIDPGQVARFFDNGILWFFPIAALASTPFLAKLWQRLMHGAKTQAVVLEIGRKMIIIGMFIFTAATMATSTYSPFIYFRF